MRCNTMGISFPIYFIITCYLKKGLSLSWESQRWNFKLYLRRELITGREQKVMGLAQGIRYLVISQLMDLWL